MNFKRKLSLIGTLLDYRKNKKDPMKEDVEDLELSRESNYVNMVCKF